MIKNKALLELFSGTGSVGRVADSLGYSVISLDLKDAKIMTDILEWDYRQLKPDEIDVIWASPPCTEYSIAKQQGVRKIDEANKIVKKTMEIIDYFKPRYFFIENPQAGLLKKQEFMRELDFYDVDYCKYGFKYRKKTRIWTNCKTWTPQPLCLRDCESIKWGRHTETAQRGPCKHHRENQHSQQQLYSIPATLISEIFLSLQF